MWFRVTFPIKNGTWISTSSYEASSDEEALSLFARIHSEAGPVQLFNDSTDSHSFYIVHGARALTLEEYARERSYVRAGRANGDTTG